jgi:DNA-binding transcriptional ArsR family regulator
VRSSPDRPDWAFVTSHGAVLVELTRRPDATVREIAERARITERQAHRVLADLVEAGYVARDRVGRRNRYRVDEARPMRHPALAERRVGELLEALTPRAERAPGSR